MALLGTEALNPEVKIDKVTVSDFGDDTNMQMVVEFHWYDSAALVLGQTDFTVPYANDPGEINDGINSTVNDLYDDAHP